MNRAPSLVEAGTSGFLSITDIELGSLWTWNKGDRPPLVLRHGTPLASLVVHGVSGHRSSRIWNLQLFLEDATRVSLPHCVVPSSLGLHVKRCPSIRTYFEWMWKSVSFGM